MSSALIVIGRILFSVVLFASAFVHLEHPDIFVDFYTETYGIAHSIAHNQGVELPAADYVQYS